MEGMLYVYTPEEYQRWVKEHWPGEVPSASSQAP
jgi:hypothetical protein